MNRPIDQVLKMPPFQALLWVRENAHGPGGSNGGVNWHGLAQSAATLAHDAQAPASWAHISVEVYSWLAQGQSEATRESFKISEMYVRAHQIRLHGAVTDHELRDAQVIVDWFERSAEFDLDEVLAMIPQWRSLPKVEILKLRRIKNRLGVIAQIQGQLTNETLDALLPWLDLRARLP